MNTRSALLILLLLVLPTRQTEATGGSKLWYTKPADDSARRISADRARWGSKFSKEALPLGNGRLGCMPYGGVQNEFVEFNEDSLWIGDEEFTGAYQAFGSFDVMFKNHDRVVQDYRRALDIEKSLHTVRYRIDDVTYEREYFASNPAEVLVFHFTADKKGAYSATIKLSDAHKAQVTAEENRITSRGNLDGYLYHSDVTKQGAKDYALDLDHEAALQVLHQGGSLRAEGNALVLNNVDSFTILLAAGTNFVLDRRQGWIGEDPHNRVDAQLARASALAYSALRQEHIDDYQQLFRRFELDLGSSNPELAALPTDRRNELFKTNGEQDLDFQELLLHYARYLMLSSSRPNGLPANLQGLWNNQNNPPWHCDYHSDVNVQMNYWFVDQFNLSECFQPYAEWLFAIREARRDQRKGDLGDVRGWQVHGSMGLVGGAAWHMIPGCAAWLVQNMWDHYAYTQDEEYLETRAYPLMKDLCEYWHDRLIEEPDGTLVSPKSKSPEHGGFHEGNAFEQQLIWDLFTNYIEASEILGRDKAFRDEVRGMKSRLLGPQVGRWGQLQEWRADIDQPVQRSKGGLPHRHISHTMAVYPCRQISPITTPELAKAASIAMKARGDGRTAWSKVQRALVWARLHDREEAFHHYETVFSHFFPNLLSTIQSGTFQIDANFGFAATIGEMLLQSHLGEIHLLPCLPPAWPDGSVRGMQARGRFSVDMQWNQFQLVRAVITSQQDSICKLRTAAPVNVVNDGRSVDATNLDNGSIRFTTEAGKSYVVTPR
jgi:alpha-L-fucosidase 2